MSYESLLISGVTAYQASPSDSGVVYDVNIAAADIKVTLPPPAVNLNYRFVITTAGTNKCTITASAATIAGFAVGNATVTGTGVLKTNVISGATAANVTTGDWCELKCDGVYWQVMCYSQAAAAGWTFS